MSIEPQAKHIICFREVRVHSKLSVLIMKTTKMMLQRLEIPSLFLPARLDPDSDKLIHLPMPESILWNQNLVASCHCPLLAPVAEQVNHLAVTMISFTNSQKKNFHGRRVSILGLFAELADHLMKCAPWMVQKAPK